MRRFLLLFCTLCMSVSAAKATITFNSSTKYRISCKYYGSGAVVTGAAHNSSAYLFYTTDEEEAEADDAWWYIEADGAGYTIKNASTGEYMTFTTERTEGVCKGLKLTEGTEDADSRWVFTENNGYLTVTNEGSPSQYLNLRLDGTYLLGTYEGSGDNNELFTITDESGNSVIDSGSSTTPSESDDFTGTQGITTEGEYWERTGLSQPVVYTTDTDNPVLYSIINLRQKQYAVASGSVLQQTDDASLATHFYFVEQESGIQVFTADGQYVSTSFPQYNVNSTGLTLESGTTTGNIWEISWYEDGTYPGYSITKLDNLATTGSGSGGQGGFDPGGGGGFQNSQSEYTSWNDYSANYIGLYNTDEGSTFVFASSDSRHTDYLATQEITFEGGGGKPSTVTLSTAADSIRLDGKQLVYDKLNKQYMATLSEQLMDGGTYTATLTSKMKEGYEDYTVTLDGKSPETDTRSITIEDPSCEKTYTLALVAPDGTECATAQLQFTFLPIVEVTVASCNGSSYTTGNIRVTYAETEGYDSTYVAAFKYRGATAQNYPKKAYAIKLRDEAGESVDRSFFGLREDNNWILDAMTVDPACMRNRVATDLWNDFASKPYYYDREPKALTGTRGHFVEMLLNGQYNGIYCMTEKLDRKQMKLKKYKSAEDSKTGEEQIRGLLYKSYDWSYEVFMGHESGSKYFPGTAPSSYKNTLGTETWRGLELKYPDYEEEAVDWEPLWNTANFVATSSQSEFESELKERFDYPVLTDYYLFIELLLATDNHGKNMFYAVYDKTGDEGERMTIAPWDLNGVWGARWDGSTKITKAAQDFDDFLWSYEHGQLTYFYKLSQSSTIDWEKELAERYAELRTSFFDPEELSQRVTAYENLFTKSRADSREENRWSSYHSGLASAADYMKTWIADRISYLDEQYGYDPTTSSVNDAKAGEYFSATGGDGAIAVNSGHSMDVCVYSVSGSLVRKTRITKGFNVIGGLTAGAYIINGKKVIVK